MRQVRFHPSAVTEAEEAAAWYSSESEGLGSQFGASLEWAVSRLEENTFVATRYPLVPPDLNVRRIRLPRFPYDVVFAEHTGEIVIFAVAHHYRRPGYWKSRLAT